MMMTRIVVGKRRAHDCPPVAVAFHTMFRMIFCWHDAVDGRWLPTAFSFRHCVSAVKFFALCVIFGSCLRSNTASPLYCIYVKL